MGCGGVCHPIPQPARPLDQSVLPGIPKEEPTGAYPGIPLARPVKVKGVDHFKEL